MELEDLRGALDWGARTGAVDEVAELFWYVRFWDALGLHYEAIERGQRYVQLLGEDDARAGAFTGTHRVPGWRKGNLALAGESAEQAIAYARIAGDPSTLADCLVRFATAVANARRFDDALTALDEAEAVPDPSARRTLQMLGARGRICIIRGDLQAAARCLDRRMELCRTVDNAFVEVSSALNLAEIAYELGDARRAIEVATGALMRAEQLSDRGVQTAHLLRNLAGYFIFAGDLERAIDVATRAIALDASREPEGTPVAISLEHVALVMALRGEIREAALLEGYASAVFQRFGFEREYTERATYMRLKAALETDVPDGELRDLLLLGAGVKAQDAIVRATSAQERTSASRHSPSP